MVRPIEPLQYDGEEEITKNLLRIIQKCNDKRTLYYFRLGMFHMNEYLNEHPLCPVNANVINFPLLVYERLNKKKLLSPC